MMVREFLVTLRARVAWQIVPEHAFNGWILQDPFCSYCCSFCIFFHPVFAKIGIRFISLPLNLLPELLYIILHTESEPLCWTRAVVDSFLEDGPAPDGETNTCLHLDGETNKQTAHRFLDAQQDMLRQTGRGDRH